jgi:2-dehydropantoate 2-reductase
MKITIIGTGGVGGYFGAKLVQAGYNVSFIARGEHLRAIQNNGLTIKSILGDFSVDNLKATDKITEINKPDLIIIGVKAWQIKEIREDISKILHKDTMILPLQNGVLASDELAEKNNKSHIIGGLCKIFSKIESPGVISHFGAEPFIAFGELDNRRTERLIKIKEVLDKSGINSRISDNIESDLWKKFILICVSGLLAVTKTTYGELRSINETRKMMVGLLDEIYSLSCVRGVKIEEDFVRKTIETIDKFAYDSTSSLTRDVWEGKPSEIEYQNGTVVRLGEKYGIETPINSFVYASILPNELKARGLDLNT